MYNWHPVIIILAVIGIIDMGIQAATSGAIKPIRMILEMLFGGV